MKDIITSLGAEAGATRTAIKKWRQRGEVPGKWQLPILRLATAQGIEVEDTDFATPKSRKVKAKRRRAA